MSKVIDFDKFRKRKAGTPVAEIRKATPSDHQQSGHTKRNNTEQEYQSIPGFLIWLHCPTCQKKEYTEVRMQGGRIHNCGTLVEEVEVQIDIRAEYTISKRNLEILEQGSQQSSSSLKEKLRKKLLGAASKLLIPIKNNELEYQRRLELMHSKSINSYPSEWDPSENGIEFMIVEPTGIIITVARQVDKYFPQSTK